MGCVFCGVEVLNQSVSHIVPESLGGSNSPVCPPGVTCHSCNQYFGQKVEALALKSFPFDALRLFYGVPSKKGRMFATDSLLGKVRSAGIRNRIEVEPRDGYTSEKLDRGQITQLRIPAEVTEPLAVCRLLLKIGIELLAKNYPETVRSERLSEARTFARRPQRNSKWWFIFRSEPSELFADFDDFQEWSMEVREVRSQLCSIVRLPTMHSLIPLEGGSLPPPPGELMEPVFRTVWAKC